MQDSGGEPTPRALAAMSHVLERLVARNDMISSSSPAEAAWRPSGASARRAGLEGFCGARAPSISIGKYVERIHRFTGCSPACFVVGFAYIDRAAHRRPGSLVVSLNVHRLLVASVLIASKVLDDTLRVSVQRIPRTNSADRETCNLDSTSRKTQLEFMCLAVRRHHNNAFYARVGGVSNIELNRLELDLLFLLDFDVLVSLRVFESYCLHLEKEMMWNGVGLKKIERPIADSVINNGDFEQSVGGGAAQQSSPLPPPQFTD